MRLTSRLATAAIVFALGTAPAWSESIALPPQPAPPGTPAPTPAPDQPATPAAGQGGELVTSVNIAAIKAVFDRNNIPNKAETLSNGFQFVSSTLSGNTVLVAPMVCENDDPAGKCSVVMMMSGIWGSKITLSKLFDYLRSPRFVSVVTDSSGKPGLRYAFSVQAGVSADYLEQSLIMFMYAMQDFAEWANAGAPSKFSAEGSSAAISSSLAELSSELDKGALTASGTSLAK